MTWSAAQRWACQLLTCFASSCSVAHAEDARTAITARAYDEVLQLMEAEADPESAIATRLYDEAMQLMRVEMSGVYPAGQTPLP